jgi:hypothetical protein
MFASRHAVFVGAGRLPKELRDVLLARQGAPQADVALNSVRLLSFFDSAVDAERVSGQVQRLKILALVVGPEQPPADADWIPVAQLTVADDAFSMPGLGRTVPFADVSRAAVVDWRVATGSLERAVLVVVGDQHLFFRASTMEIDRAVSSTAALRVLTSLTEGLSRAGVELRSRKLTPEEVGAPTLTGDLLPLALAVVDAVDQPQQPRAGMDLPVELVPVRPSRLAVRVGASGFLIATLGLAAAQPIVAGSGLALVLYAIWRGYRTG